MNASKFRWNVLHGIYGNAAEVHAYGSRLLTTAELADVYACREVRETLADMPADEIDELLAAQ